jgi:hypothetical protein
MPNVTSEFSEMRFRKSLTSDVRNFTMSPEMYRLFFALDENKTMSQMSSQQQMDLAVMMDCISRLWMQGLVEPVGLTNLCVDQNFPKLLKINLHYIMGRKDIAYACVDAALKDLGLLAGQLPADRAGELVAAVSSKISDPEISEKYRNFVETLVPLRVKMKQIPEKRSGDIAANLAGVSRGKTRQIIDRILAVRSGGNPVIAGNIKTKLMLKGVNPDSYFDDTVDNPITVERLRSLAAQMGVDLDEHRLPEGVAKGSRGEVRRLILSIIQNRSKGNPLIAKSIRTKLFLKGIDVDRYGPDTPDNPIVLDKLKSLAGAMGL